jgi:predicted  nucleic acid-binding Zn-ribbon protein
MNNENTEIQELKYLLEVISLLRSDLKEINQKFNRIEKRIGGSFPLYNELKKASPEIIEMDNNRENLLKIFEELKDMTKKKNDLDFSLKVKEYSPETIVALALELGVSGSKKMGIAKAIAGIKNRIQESILLS